MDRRTRIPVNVTPRTHRPGIQPNEEPIVSGAQPAVSSSQDIEDQAGPVGEPQARQPGDVPRPTRGAAGQAEPPADQTELEDWRDRALRLQAEMENFRKRQQRLAQDQIERERQRLLLGFLRVVDDLERALASGSRDGSGLREGVELTHRSARQLLEREGVEPVHEVGRPFDPNWHEAVTTVDHNQAGVAPNTIVEVLEPGYRRGDQLLRPARVVVAV